MKQLLRNVPPTGIFLGIVYDLKNMWGRSIGISIFSCIRFATL